MRRPLAVLPLALVLLAGAASAQADVVASSAGGEQGLLALTPERPLPDPFPVAPGEVVHLNWSAENPTDEGYVVVLTTQGPAAWNATVVPGSFTLPPRAEGAVRQFQLSFAVPRNAAVGDHELRLRATAANSTSGTVAVHEVGLALRVTHTALVLGLFENPLPAPLDNAYGVFLLDILFWALIAGTIILLQEPIVRWLTRKAEKSVSARIVNLLRVPMFFALVFLGITQAWGALPPAWWVELGRRILAGGTILVWMYVIYKAFRAVTLYYAENIAAKTSSELDDILVPVVEKVGAVLIVLGGVLYLLGTLGLDLTAFVAGGVVVSMVLAFAAQDTLSNFFAGLFLMLDRPFIRGDDIMLTAGGPLTGEVFRVDHVGLRSSRLYHYKNHQLVTVPNNDLAKNPVVNLMGPDHRFRVSQQFTLEHGTDVELVRRLALEAAKAHPLVEKEERYKPTCNLDGFSDAGLQFTLLFFVHDLKKRFDAASDVRAALLQAFEANRVAFAVPHRVVRMVQDGGSTPPGTTHLPPGPGAAKRS